MNTVKFAQPVSMPCTEEQYKTHLADKMQSLGYVYNAYDVNTYICNYIATSYCLDRGAVGYVADNTKRSTNRHFIPTFQPDLFLAIAAMTEGDAPIVGEWMIAKKDFKPWAIQLRAGALVQVTSFDFYSGGEYGNFFGSKQDSWGESEFWRKPTLQEIINHFNKETQTPATEPHLLKLDSKVIVWNDDADLKKSRLYFGTSKNPDFPYLTVDPQSVQAYKDGKQFRLESWKHAEPYRVEKTLTVDDIKKAFGADSFTLIGYVECKHPDGFTEPVGDEGHHKCVHCGDTIPF